MSFLTGTASGNLPVLIRDLWPYDRLPKDPATLVDCSIWEAVPLEVVDLADWLVVVPKKQGVDKSRPFQVIHAPTDDDTVKYEVGLRIQGIVHDCNLNPVGNWDGTVYGAQNAVQHLVLHGRGFKDQWMQTLQQLNKIITVVTRLAEPRHDLHLLSEVPGSVLPLQRRVFDRVLHSAGDASTGDLDPSISKPHATTIRGMAARWSLSAPLAVGAARDGAIRRANHIVIRPGNFVDILATIEIARKNRGTRVFFKLERVVQVEASEEIPPIVDTAAVQDDEDDDVVHTNADSIFIADD